LGCYTPYVFQCSSVENKNKIVQRQNRAEFAQTVTTIFWKNGFDTNNYIKSAKSKNDF